MAIVLKTTSNFILELIRDTFSPEKRSNNQFDEEFFDLVKRTFFRK